MSPEGSMPLNQPPKLFTHGEQRKHFEKYEKGHRLEFGDEEYEAVRQEVAAFYDVPPEHRYFIADDKLQNVRRTQRAFSVVILNTGERYYIDGRTPHATLLRALKNTFKVDFDIEGEEYASVHGFIDPGEFEDVPMVQAKAIELGKPITWFVRYTVSSSSSPSTPRAPIELS
jgi:hypothetical protein